MKTTKNQGNGSPTTRESVYFLEVDATRYLRISRTPESPGWWDVEVVGMGWERLIGSGKGLREARKMARAWRDDTWHRETQDAIAELLRNPPKVDPVPQGYVGER